IPCGKDAEWRRTEGSSRSERPARLQRAGGCSCQPAWAAKRGRRGRRRRSTLERRRCARRSSFVQDDAHERVVDGELAAAGVVDEPELLEFVQKEIHPRA